MLTPEPIKRHSINAIFVKVLAIFFVLSFNTLTAQNILQEKPIDSLTIITYHLPENCFYPRKTEAEMQFVVLHFCSDAVHNPSNPYQVARIYEIFTEYSVSAHYLIDREGNVYNLVPEEMAAKHASYGSLPNQSYLDNSMNHYSIGIELMAIGAKDEMAMYFPNYFEEKFAQIKPEDIGFTLEQYASLNLLLKSIYHRYPTIKVDRQHIIGHSEYRKGSRTDPGRLFEWERIGLPSSSVY